MVYVLGIHDGHTATAALIKDGKIICAVSEERFTNFKNQPGLPKNSINFCLDFAKISPSDLDLVVLASIHTPPTFVTYVDTKTRSLYYILKKSKNVVYKFPQNMYESIFKKVSPFIYKKTKTARIKSVSNFLKIPEEKINVVEHHTAHAYTAYYGSGYIKDDEEFLIFTLDGEGDGVSATVNIANRNGIKRIAQTSNYASIGLLYLETTRYLGMKPLEHEYKVMGLAPYAPINYVKSVYNEIKELINVDDSLTFSSKRGSREYFNYIKSKFYLKRFDTIAGAIQKMTEDLVTKWIKLAIKKTNIRNIALAGGVFMNVKLNLAISKLKEVNRMFIFPSCGDESLAIGAAYWGYNQLTKEEPENLKDLYLGPSYTSSEVKKFIDENKVNLKYHVENLSESQLTKRIAELLLEGKVIALLQGRMEWGARALGNRSILANPTNPKIVKDINLRIKKRDFWMPFAPSILDSREKDYIINPKKIPAPYMILAFDTTDEGKEKLGAAIHPYDFTTRPQIVYKKWNEKYWRMIKEFEKVSGIGAVLNTSFNLHGYPIVNSPKDALFTFENSGLEYLVIDNFLISKS